MDIDIDTKGNFIPEDIFSKCIRASMVQNGKLLKHQAGVYFQNAPIDKITGLCAIPYDKAEDYGLIKIDFLHLPSVLDYFESKEEIRTLMHIEPDWKLLRKKSIVDILFHIRNHFDIISAIKPTSVEELSDCIALKIPSKRPLLKKYLQNRNNVLKVLYREPSDGSYYFKKGHSLAYAYNVILQLHLVKGKIFKEVL